MSLSGRAVQLSFTVKAKEGKETPPGGRLLRKIFFFLFVRFLQLRFLPFATDWPSCAFPWGPPGAPLPLPCADALRPAVPANGKGARGPRSPDAPQPQPRRRVTVPALDRFYANRLTPEPALREVPGEGGSGGWVGSPLQLPRLEPRNGAPPSSPIKTGTFLTFIHARSETSSSTTSSQ